MATDVRRPRSAPAARTGWWLVLAAAAAWVCFRDLEEGRVLLISVVGATAFIAVFALSVARVAAQRWWGGSISAR